MTKEQLKKAGIAARHLLEFAWANQSVYLNLIRSAISGVCKTFESDPRASEELLRKIIEPEHLKEKGYEELFALGQELKRLISLAPEFVRDTYIAAFGCHEQPEGAVHSGGSLSALIIPHKKAYENNLFMLANDFAEFLTKAPVEATEAVAPIMLEYAEVQKSVRKKEEEKFYREFLGTYDNGTSSAEPETCEEEPPRFEFDGRQLFFISDDSYGLDSGYPREANEVEILNAFQNYLRELCVQGDTQRLKKLLVILLKEKQRVAAVILRKLLELGVEHPTTIGLLIRSFAWTKIILEEKDTTYEAGEFVKAIHPLLSKDEKLLIEQVILKIPEGITEELKEWAEHRMSRMLSCLSEEEIEDIQVRELITKFRAEGKLYPNRPLIQVEPATSRPYTASDSLKERGVPIDDPKHAQILELSKPLTQFSKDFLNEIPGKEDAEKIFPALKEFHTALIEASESGVKEDLLNQGWDCLADACANITKMEGLSCKEVLGQFVKRVLLEASNNSVPEYDEFEAKQFDRNQGICKPAPRVEAALGLIRFGRFKDCLDDKVLEVIYKLSQDEVPQVRYEIASNLTLLYSNAKETMWLLIERFALEEKNRGVLKRFINLTLNLQSLILEDTDKVVGLAKSIYDRIKEGDGAEEVRQGCRSVFLKALLWKDHKPSRGIIEDIIKEPEAYHEECQEILSSIREVLIYGAVETTDSQASGDRRRAIVLFRKIVEISKAKFLELWGQPVRGGKEELKEGEKGPYQNLKEILTTAGSQLYYASGALDLKSSSSDRKPPSFEVRKRFFEETGDMVDSLAEIAITPLAHHLLEILETQVDFAPLKVFLRVGTIIRVGQTERLEYEYQVVDIFVRLIECYLSKHRDIFQVSQEARQSLLDVLNIFADAGWPKARRLTYRLGEIYR